MSLNCTTERSPYCLGLGLLGAMVAFPCLGQPPHPEPGVANVRIDALVTEQGQIVTGLRQGDFLIRDEGEPRSTVAFASEVLPLDVVLLCQFVNSPPDGKYLENFSQPQDIPSQTSRNRAVIQAFEYSSQSNMNSAALALRGLRPEDRVAVISFGLDPQIEQPLTSDRAEIAAALRRIGMRSGPTVSGSDFMAIEWGLRLLAKERDKEEDSLRRSAILIVSFSGNFTPAMFNDEPAIFRLWQENAVLSAINAGRVAPMRLEPSASHYRFDNLAHIADQTGGDVVVMPTDDFPDLLARVRSSYSLWLRPPKAKPGTVRRITVELTEKAKKLHPGAEIQARKGYVVR
jgi:von Willebrand factor type A domain